MLLFIVGFLKKENYYKKSNNKSHLPHGSSRNNKKREIREAVASLSLLCGGPLRGPGTTKKGKRRSSAPSMFFFLILKRKKRRPELTLDSLFLWPGIEGMFLSSSLFIYRKERRKERCSSPRLLFSFQKKKDHGDERARGLFLCHLWPTISQGPQDKGTSGVFSLSFHNVNNMKR